MFQGEARFGRVSDTRRCWCPKSVRPLCQDMVTQKYTYAYGAGSIADGQFDTLILPHVNGHKCAPRTSNSILLFPETLGVLGALVVRNIVMLSINIALPGY
ncbi:protein of unknown function [Georgfuchsia toluolica]|uniref:Uncharacterized protein n=1 Tax=Georgfuchsia toluolica TaxID=424218 RepID=A0A916J6B4_9PROT|nr:protein of unknown function [Georgfuchsia toluolica]